MAASSVPGPRRTPVEYLLLDSAHIHESDARYLNYKTVRGLLYQMKTSPGTQGVSKSDAKKIQNLLKKDQHELNVDVINDLLDKYRLEKIIPIYYHRRCGTGPDIF